MNSTISFYFHGKDLVLNVENRISLTEEESLVESVVNALFDEKNVYHPSRKDYYLWSMILGKYTDFNFDDYTANEICAIIDDSDMKARLEESISAGQLRRMHCSIEGLISVRLNEHPLKGVMAIIKSALSEGSDAVQKLFTDENFRSKLTEYINAGDQAAFISAVNDAAYRNA